MRRWFFAFVLFSGLVTACGPSYPDCERDDNCHPGEYCVLRHCQQCRNANDCSSSQRCVEGRCE